MMSFKFILVANLLLIPVVVFSQVSKEKPLIQTFKNSNCKVSNTCDLKEFKLHAYDYQVKYPDGSSYGTGAYISYKTEKVEHLERYAVVQFIRGCSFYSKDTGPARSFQIKREFFGDLVTFHHPNWVIDSIDKDPVYNSLRPENRHGGYRWNEIPGTTNDNTEVYYSKREPTNPELYVRDLPGTAFYLNGRAKNLSLNFKVCLYKSSEIPLETKADDIEFAQPVHCFNWDSSFVYNHSTQKMERSKILDPICMQDLLLNENMEAINPSVQND